MTDQAPHVLILNWWPVRRANPHSTLRGYADVALPSGLILRRLSICASDGSAWVVPPSRLKLDRNNVPIGVGEDAQWETLVEFKNRKVRDRFCVVVLDALRSDYPEARL